MHDYMEYARFINLKLTGLEDLQLERLKGKATIKTYIPLLNIYGPYFFYPPHCHPSAGTGLFHSPVIGVFRHDNEVEDDIINSLQ